MAVVYVQATSSEMAKDHRSRPVTAFLPPRPPGRTSVLVTPNRRFIAFLMKNLRLLAILGFLVSPTFSRDFLPEGHMENIPLADSSIQQCYVFRTTAGVGYTVESSTDLSNWTSQDEIYGLGNEYVVTMREYTPPPPPPPGTPPASRPPPAINASIRLQRASGPEGGTVVSWPSHDQGDPIVVRIAGAMDPGWNQIPLFSNRFDGYYFFIWHPWDLVAPPTVNSILGPKDSALLAVLEANLPAMNQQVADSVFRSRNAPLPGPELPGSKRFWRVKVDPDVDTDSDGSPDWAEFEIVARGTGMLVSGVIGNPFDPDTNGDNIPDGQQLDADGDGTPDFMDPDASDNTAFYSISPVPRYALFPIQDATGAGASQPYEVLQINDKGRVLYRNATWIAGVWTPLAPPSNGSSGMSLLAGAYAINDNDVIIGKGRYELRADPEYLTNLLYFWSSPQAVPLPVKQNADINQAYAGDFVYPYLSANDPTRKTFLSNDGIFTGVTRKWTADANGDFGEKDVHYSTWTLPSGPGSLSTKGSVSQEMQFHKSPGLSWNFKPESQSNGKVFIPAALPDLPFQPLQVFATPQGTLAFPETDTAGSPKLFIDGAWKNAPLYQHATDMADDGIAIGRSHANFTAPILLNGKWTGITRSAPGLTGIWTDTEVWLSNTTPSGWILAQHSPVATDNAAVMLPIKVDGVDPDVVPPPLPPAPGTAPFDPPEFLAGGVDHTSMMAEGGSGRVPEIWIMAPNGGAFNTVRFQSPVSDSSKLTLAPKEGATSISFSPPILDHKDMQIHVSGKSLATDTTEDIEPDLKLGGTLKSLSVPLKIKAMKKRVVHVALHKVLGLSDTSVQTSPSYLPTAAQLEPYLDKIYGRQVNTTFKVHEFTESGDFDLNNDHKLWVPSPNPEFTAATLNPKAGTGNPPINIDVWVIGGGVALAYLDENSLERQAYGVRHDSIILVDGDLTVMPGRRRNIPAGEEVEKVMHTIAHEIGHVMTNDGHPGDQRYKSALVWDGNGGRDPYLKKRLMCSGFEGNPKDRGTCLIKKEWDWIEEWLINEEIQGRITP